jgi:hypothetical protein
MTLIDGLISCTGLVPNDPWVVAHVVGILWVVAHRPLWTRLVVVALDDDDTHYEVVALVSSSGS